MTKGKALLAAILIAAITVISIVFSNANEDNEIFSNDIIHIWYTDESLTDYINSAALEYSEQSGTKIVPVYCTGLDYLDRLYAASIEGDEVPDIYIIGSDSIESAGMAGLAIPVNDKSFVLDNDYPEISCRAVTYNDEIYGYPFYYDTAYLLCNKTYLEEIADKALVNDLAFANMNEGEESESVSEADIKAAYSDEEWKQKVLDKSNELIPKSIEDILEMANNYNAPDGVETYFNFDVSDIFYNYFFTGAYMNVGGPYGDDKKVIDICNADTIRCMEVYQSLNQFFSIESTESSYEEVLNDFIEGKMIFTIATTDAIARLEKAKKDGTFEYEYSLSNLPGVDKEHEAKGLSFTNCIVVNGYGDNIDEANSFAKYLLEDSEHTFWQRTGKISCKNSNTEEQNEAYSCINEIYSYSNPLPKIAQLSNFWIELENTYTRIWDGADVSDELSGLQDKMNEQISDTVL